MADPNQAQIAYDRIAALTDKSPDNIYRITQDVYARAVAAAAASIANNGGTPGGSGAVTRLATQTLSTPGTFDITGIDQTYSDLTLRLIVRGTDVGATDTLRLRLNNDSTNSYGSNWMLASDSTFINGHDPSTSSWNLKNIPAAGLGATVWSYLDVLLPGYASTARQKAFIAHTVFAGNAAANGSEINYNTGVWVGTDAITRIELYCATTANLAAGSEARLYGAT